MAFQKKWSLDQDDYIIRNYQSLGPDVCADVLGRSVKHIRRRAHVLKVTRPHAPRPRTVVHFLRPSAHASVKQSAFIQPPTKARLMAGR